MAGNADLVQVVGAGHAIGSRPNLLNRREQESDQDSDNRDDDEKFDERKAAPAHGTNPPVKAKLKQPL
jgi:hypothetical protein